MDLKSGYPYWLVKNGLLRVYPPLDQAITCDVAVIGGGITGALVAYHLVEAGIDTVVLDKRHIGWGSTCASTALLQYEIDTPLCQLIDLVGEKHAVRSYLASLQAIDKLARLAAAIPGEHGFQRKQSLYLASKRKDRNELQQEYAVRRKHGIRLDWLDENAVEALCGFQRPAALLSYDAAQVDAYRFTHGLLAAAMERGLRIFDRTEVEKFEHSEKQIVLATIRNYPVTTRKIVFATGYESQLYLKQKVARLISTYALASEPCLTLPQWLEQTLLWESTRPYLYMRTTEDGRIIAGGEDEDFRDHKRRDRLLPAKTKRLVKKVNALLPALPLEAAFSWTGTFGETKDGLAYIGETSEFPNAYFALGYGGNGITYSILAAEIIRDHVLGRPNEHSDLFRFDR